MVIEKRITIGDILNRGRRFLSTSHRAVKPLEPATVETVPELFNQRNVMRVLGNMNVRPMSSAALKDLKTKTRHERSPSPLSPRRPVIRSLRENGQTLKTPILNRSDRSAHS
jgi:hypothetical protein